VNGSDPADAHETTTPEETDREVEAWLAEATGIDAEQVHRELEEGQRRRQFVADELIESGFSPPAVVDGVMRLTGLDEAEARALVAERMKEAHVDEDETFEAQRLLKELEEEEKVVSARRAKLHERMSMYPDAAATREEEERQLSARRRELHRQIDTLREQLNLPRGPRGAN
jgi:hypothetical protein